MKSELFESIITLPVNHPRIYEYHPSLGGDSEQLLVLHSRRTNLSTFGSVHGWTKVDFAHLVEIVDDRLS